MRKIKLISVGPPATDADALIDSLGVTQNEKKRIHRLLSFKKRALSGQKKLNREKAPRNTSDGVITITSEGAIYEEVSKRSRKSA